MSAQSIAAELSGTDQVAVSTIEIVRAALARCANIEDGEKILPSDNLLDLRPFGFDDFGAVELMMEIEEAFGIELQSREWAAPKTVRDLIVLVEERRLKTGV